MARPRAPALLLASLCLALPAAAEPPALFTDRLTRLGFDAWTSETGLLQNSVTSLLQDRPGYLWAGTLEGATRFDGQRFADRREPALRALPGGPVMALAQDPAGGLWMGTMSRGLFHVGFREASPALLPDERVLAVLPTGPGAAWVGTGQGLARIEGRELRRVLRVADGLPHATVAALAQAPDGSVWIGTGSGLARLEDGRVSLDGVPEALRQVPIRTLALEADGSLWVGTLGKGLHRRAAGTWASWTAAEGLHDFIGAVLPAGDRAWVGTRVGLFRIGPSGVEGFPASHPLARATVLALRLDNQGSLWAGTQTDGLLRVRTTRIQALTTREGLADGMAMSVAEAADGAWLVATATAGLNSVRGERVSVLSKEHGLPSARATCVLEGRGGELWIGTSGGGLVRRKGETLTRFTQAGGELASDFVLALFEDAQGRLWVGTNTGGASRFDGHTWRSWGPEQGLPARAVTGFAQDRSGALWVATQRGLVRIVGEELRVFTRADGLPESFLTTLHLDRGGALWIGTLGGGLLRHFEGRFSRVTTAQGLPSDTVYAILEDDDDHFWMSSNKGIFTASRAALVRAAVEGGSGLGARLFGRADGMPATECNGGSQPAAWRTRDGRLLFPTLAGLAIVDPRRLGAERSPVPVVVESLRADGRTLDLDGPPVLPAGTRNLEIDFAALTFLGPERIAFRYRLAGYDEHWTESGRRRTAYLANLPPGPYRFEVIASNADGVWSSDGASLEFSLLPHFWQTRWFLVLASVLGLAAALGGHRFRLRRLEARRRELEDEVELRTTELAQANEQLQRLADHDGVTGIANHRHFQDCLRREWARAARSGETLSLVLADIDAFKLYNDTYGHPAGDACLARVAAAFAAELRRPHDLAARYGGEEFAALLPGTEPAGALAVAEGMRRAVEALRIPHRASPAASNVTLSLGVASWVPAHGGGPPELVSAADAALYAAKHGGRNRVEGAPSS